MPAAPNDLTPDELNGARALLEEALELQEAGDIEAAEPRYRAVIEMGYRREDVLPILAGILGQTNASEQALEQWDALLTLDPNHAVAHHEKALIYSRVGQWEQGLEAMQASCALDPANPIAVSNLGVMLSNAGRKDEALDQFNEALILDPGNLLIEHQIRRLHSEMVPFWHIPMLNDTRRNDAFEAAILTAIAATIEANEEPRVLDIGTGSGLLSMMAARAGAQTITGCEMCSVIADAARPIIADNGYAEEITLHTMPSTELEVGEHMKTRANILVSEILSSDLLAESVLDTFEDAHERLIESDAIVIPRGASAVGCLVESSVLADYVFVDEVSGFDVSRFGGLGPAKLPIHGTMTEWTRLSQDVELVHLDLTRPKHASVLREQHVEVTADGVAMGIVQWMQVDLAQGITFDNHPDGYTDGGWLQVLHPFPEAIAVRAGDVLRLAVGHDRETLILRPLNVVPA